MSNSSNNNIAMNNRDQVGEATRTFLTHIRSYLSSLTLVAFGSILIPICVSLINLLLSIGFQHNHLLYSWVYLSVSEIIYHFQVYRLILFPIVTNNASFLFTNLLIITPYISKHERRYGSLRTLYELSVLFTLIPALVYVTLFGLIIGSSSTLQYVSVAGCSGLSGIAVGLSLLTMLNEQSDGIETTHSLFGVVPISSRIVPGLIFAFYFFLVPDSSVFLNLASAIVAYLYATKQLTTKILPSDDTYRHYESHALTKSLTTFRNFVSIDSTGYLPVSTNNVIPATTSTNPATSAHFPGQGHRLGD
ncbi:unnamed protein product [Cunninghamella blakesleeana]